MPRMSGIEFVERYRAQGGEALVIVMTAYGSSDLAIEAMRKGAYDYISKPFSAEELVLVLKKAEERESLRREVTRLREEVRIERRFSEIIAKAPVMQKASRWPPSPGTPRPSYRRERDGEGARRPTDPQPERAGCRPLRPPELRRDPGIAARGRALRLQQRRVHRRRA